MKGRKKMTKGDEYHKIVINKILTEGALDENPRPRYASDGAPAYTYSINHVIQQYDLSKNETPLLTLRQTFIKNAINEILWIYQKQSNRLSDLHNMGIRYWDQWDIGNGTIGCRYGETVRRHNLMNKLLNGLKNDPFGRRHIISLWQEDDFADDTGGTTKGLNPCCYETIWNVRKNSNGELYLDMLMNQRSSDYIVSVSINEIQYMALLIMVAKHCGYKPGKFTHVIENCQIYDRHIDIAKEMLERKPIACNPSLDITGNESDFWGFSYNSFTLTGYPTDMIKKMNPTPVFDIGV